MIKKISTIYFSTLILFISSFGLFLVPVAVSAANFTLFPCSGGSDNTISSGATGGGSTNNRECTFGDLVELAQAVADKIVQVGLILSPLIFAYAGWLLITSGDNPGNRKKAQGIFLNVCIGLAIMMGAWLAVKLVLTALVNSSIYNNQAFPIKVN